MIISKFIPKIYLFSLLTASLFFISCEKNETAEVNSAESMQEAPVALKDKNFVVPATNANPTVGGDVALNPEHGQPGHTCALPVGAPLNGSAPAAPAQNQNMTPMPMNDLNPGMLQTTPTVPTGAGLNPEHGQPGHVCEIPVGAPL